MGGTNGEGTIFELTPSGQGWTEQTLETFDGANGEFPTGGLIQDGVGNLYGTSSYTGTAFDLLSRNGGYSFNLLYTFTGTRGPEEKLLLDANGIRTTRW